MVNLTEEKSITISLNKTQGDGVVILPLEKYEKMKEDLEMFRSKKLFKDINRARKEAKRGKIISLKEVEKRLSL